MNDVLLSRGANKFLSAADEKAAFKVDPSFEVNCFASEEDFPEMACPIAMRWDKHGRLWVSTSVTYPHVYQGQKPYDKIIILEDTDQDGKADKCSTWANDLHIPLSFVLDGNGGVYCSEQPHLTHLTDRDRDGKIDHREIVFTGFGCEDSHHSLHDFMWTPGGEVGCGRLALGRRAAGARKRATPNIGVTRWQFFSFGLTLCPLLRLSSFRGGV